MWRYAIIGGLLTMSFSQAGAKSEPTYYTTTRIAAGQANLAQYEWARALEQRMMTGDANTYYIGRDYGSATDCIAQTDDFIWLMQPTTLLPRVPPDHDTQALCPVHGEEVRKTSVWTAWTTDPINHPYKVRCHAGGEWYPSNDYMNGDLTSGDFPDDGNGCLYQGKRYYFLREYAHMAYGNNTIPCLRSLSQAWVLTGDRRYARAGCILLARLASEYPNFTDRKDRLFYALYGGEDPHYRGKTGGMITDLIWETFCLEGAAYAYDGLWSYMDQDPDLLAFLRGKGLAVQTGDDLRRYIEDNLIRVGMEGLLNGHIHGNEGHHQAAALACALVLDDYSPDRHPNSKDLVDYAFHGIGRGAWITINGLTTDGGGNESPNYSLIKLDFIRVNRLMEEVRRRQPDLFPTDKYPDLFGNAKGRMIFDYYIDILINNDILPSVGDCGGISASVSRRKPRIYSALSRENLYAVERFGDPRYARACTTVAGEPVAGELFEAYPEALLTSLLRRPESAIRRLPRLLDGYGVAIMESGDGPTHHALALNYSSIVGHRQYDNLNLELWARGIDLLPDLGYPTGWGYRDQWDAATIAHNTVTVNETNATYGQGGRCNLFASAGGVHVASLRHDPYPAGTKAGAYAPGVDLYERTTVMVDVAPDRFYVVDLFSVAGGDLHTQSWHGPLRPVTLPPLKWSEQATGTLAGPEVPQFGSYTDRWGRNDSSFASFLTGIRKATLTEPATWSWDYGQPEGDRLNLHVVPVDGPLEMVVGNGCSPARPEGWALDYVLARREAHGGASRFLTVLDAYQGTPVVTGVRLVSASPLVLQVQRGDETDEITLSAPGGVSRTTDHRPLGVRVQTLGGGREVRIGEYGAQAEPGYLHSIIREVDYAGHRIALRQSGSRLADLAVGQYLRIHNDGQSAMYRVTALKQAGDMLWVTLDRPALLAQGPVVKTADGAVWIQAFLDWGLSGNTPDGDLEVHPGGDYFAGAWLGEGAQARKLRGAIRDMPSKLFLERNVPEADLQAGYGGTVVSIWQYGVGDLVEAPRVVVR